MSLPAWEHFYHMADIGVRGRGRSMAEAFEQVALAMTAVITEPERIQPQQVITVSCSAPEPELLLVDWLNALIYEMATRKMLFSQFEVSLQNTRLTGRAWGEKVDIPRHQPTVEIKGATYTELKVEQQTDGCWLAQCVVDV
jgi:tRNA nucleotidyltransferase (CCA-adding enzyme)